MELKLPAKSYFSSGLFNINVYYDMKTVLKFMSRLLVELFLQTFLSAKWNTTTKCSSTTQVIAAPQKNMKLQVLPCSRNDNDENFNSIGRVEISMVMERLGIEFDHDHDHDATVDGVFSLFEDEEEEEKGRSVVAISLEDMVVISDAFDVFDKNKDGFIDHKELQMVLCALGMQQGSQLELEECRRMIREFDDNGDGLIDFQEFLTLIRY